MKRFFQTYFRSLCFTVLLLLSVHVAAQETMAVGQVLNSADKTPVPYVSIYFKNTKTIAYSNEEGYFLIRHNGKENVLIFSAVGFHPQEFKLKSGQSVGMQVELEEKNAILQEVLVLPGSNPASECMRRVRLLRSENDLTKQIGFSTIKKEQNVVLLSKVDQTNINRHIYNQLRKGSIKTSIDSSLVVPLYMGENSVMETNGQKKELSRNVFSSPESTEKLVARLMGDVSIDINFYQNSIVVFGKSIISPLANIGNAYYDYFMADSVHKPTGKQYEIHFRSKNVKNLAFNGKLWVDSATFALTRIEAELPAKSNINFIHNLHISQQFIPFNHRWTRRSEELGLNINYELMADSLHPRPELFIKRSANYQLTDSTLKYSEHFASTPYTLENLDTKLNALGNTPLIRTAKWIADAALTGYFQVGKIDIGRIPELTRVSDLEGVRLNLPFRTNQYLWKNVSIGGSMAYGTKNKVIKYSSFGQFRLPGRVKRVIGINYTNDYRRIDYNYNDFMYRENPLATGDEDLSNTWLALWSAYKLSERNEFTVTINNDWNSDIESSLYLRSYRLFSNAVLPMQSGAESFRSLKINSATFYTRFSFDERTFEDHLQRIYIQNNKPVIGITLEAGNFAFGNKKGTYGKISGALKHFIRFGVGDFNYVAEAGCVLGNVPYSLLEVPMGTEAGGYGMYKLNIPAESGTGSYSMYVYNMMKYMEYGADRYLNFHGEMTMNGLIMNNIPLIRLLNLRELFTVKMAAGLTSKSHIKQLDLPEFMEPLNKPYVELGAGVTNILHVFSLQSVWRLTDTHKPGVFPWGIRAGISLSF